MDYSQYPPKLREIMSRFDQEITALFQSLRAGELLPEDWKGATERVIAKYLPAAMMAGAKSPDLLPEQVVALQERLGVQLGFFNNFADVVERGLAMATEFVPVEGAAVATPEHYLNEAPATPWKQYEARLRSYVRSAVAPYWMGATGALPLPAIPADGTTQCGQGCKCAWEIRPQDAAKGDFDCYWRLRPAEHCQTCIQRARDWNPLRVRDWQLVLPNATTYREAAASLKEAFAALGLTLKHLQGKHDQKTHGNRGKPGSKRSGENESPELLQWFGDSKIVDKKGRPLVVYHGSRAEFETFDTKSSEMGSHFGSGGQASSFGRAKPYYLKITNPMRMQDYGRFDPANVASHLVDLDLAEMDFVDEVLEMSAKDAIRTVQKKMQSLGFDGIVYLNRREGVKVDEDDEGGFELEATDEEFLEKYPRAKDSYIIFEPYQARLATTSGRKEVALKHLQGKHDQKTHGHRGGISITEAEKRLASGGQNKETFYAFNAAGKLVGTGEGELGSAYVPDEWTPKLQGGTILHNHPSGTSLSMGDIEAAVDTGYGCIKAVVSNGNVYSIKIDPAIHEKFSAKPAEFVARGDDIIQIGNQSLRQIYNDALNTAIQRLENRMFAGKISRNEAQNLIWHYANQIFVEKAKKVRGFQFEYTVNGSTVTLKHLQGQHDQKTHGNRENRPVQGPDQSGYKWGKPIHYADGKSAIVASTRDLEIDDSGESKAFITPDGKVLNVIHKDRREFGRGTDILTHGQFVAEFWQEMMVPRGKRTLGAVEKGYIRLGYAKNSLAISLPAMDRKNLRRLQGLVDRGIVHLPGPDTKIEIEFIDSTNFVTTNYAELMNAHTIVNGTLKEVTLKGGPGSGHFGHASKPGHRGGSLPGDAGLSITGGKPEVRLQRIIGSYQRALQRMRKNGADADEIVKVLGKANARIQKFLAAEKESALQGLADLNHQVEQSARSRNWVEFQDINRWGLALHEIAQLEDRRNDFVREIVLEGLALPEGSYSPKIHSNLRPGIPGISNRSEIHLEGATRILKMVPASLIDETIPNPFYRGKRGAKNELVITVGSGTPGAGCYEVETDSVYVTGGGDTKEDPHYTRSAIAHETAHWLSARIPDANAAARRELERRAGTESPQIDQSGGFVVKKDLFIDPYMGRLYSHKIFLDASGPRWYVDEPMRLNDGSEILSVATEFLYRTPSALIEKDPESLKFLLTTLFGVPDKGTAEKARKFADAEADGGI